MRVGLTCSAAACRGLPGPVIHIFAGLNGGGVPLAGSERPMTACGQSNPALPATALSRTRATRARPGRVPKSALATYRLRFMAPRRNVTGNTNRIVTPEQAAASTFRGRGLLATVPVDDSGELFAEHYGLGIYSVQRSCGTAWGHAGGYPAGFSTTQGRGRTPDRAQPRQSRVAARQCEYVRPADRRFRLSWLTIPGSGITRRCDLHVLGSREPSLCTNPGS
jgi:hypothetical protein